MLALRAYAKQDPSRLVFEEAATPTIGTGDVLVRVHASGVSPGELDWPGAWLEHDGSPRVPPIVPGHELAGVIEAVGSDVDGLAVGDEVFGYIDVRRDGADAEYVAVGAHELARTPTSLTAAEASAVPLSALTAWQAFFDHGGLTAGQRVLVHGGAGGVGTFAVQFARWCGAHVIATSSARDADRVRELGADEVIDYRGTPFEQVLADVDLVLDTVGGDTWERSWQVLAPEGRLVSIAVPRPPDRAPGDDPRETIWFVVRPDAAQLARIGELIDAGDVRPIVSDLVPLARGGEVYGPGGRRAGPGKVVLVVDGDATTAST